MIRLSTSHAEKLCLAFSISLIDATALRTSPRVARIDEPNRDTVVLFFGAGASVYLADFVPYF
jgi:hypothetical protein